MDTMYIETQNLGRRPIQYRPNTSDALVFHQIFANHDYDISRLPRAADIHASYDDILSAGHTPLIIDAGANIGLSTLYFADVWPKAHVIAIEPDPANFALLCTNSGDLPRVTCVNAALASSSGGAQLIDPGLGYWGLRATPVETIDAADVPSIGMGGLLTNYDYQPFLVKIDIEGGESYLFSEKTEWIDRFTLLIIELHDWMLPRQGTSHNFLREIAKRDRDFVYVGENIFSIANRLET